MIMIMYLMSMYVNNSNDDVLKCYFSYKFFTR